MNWDLTIACVAVIAIFGSMFFLISYIGFMDANVMATITMLIAMLISALFLVLRKRYEPVWESVWTTFEPVQEGAREGIGAALLATGIDFRVSLETVYAFGETSYEIFNIEPGDLHIVVQKRDPEIVYLGPARTDNVEEVTELKLLVERALG